MFRAITCLVLIGLIGCSSRAPTPIAPVDMPNNPGANWFCEMHPDGEKWDCVRDEELARHPTPSRLPEAKPIPATLNRSAISRPSPIVSEAAPPVAPPAPEQHTTRTAESPAADISRQPETEQLPKHIRLAYKPEKPTNIVDLPADFYAVQLIAMSSRDTLETFVNDHELQGISAARIANDGKVYFILILGIYETAAIAAEAAEEIPPPLNKKPPWIRRLGPLQQAMIRADKIADDRRP